MTAPKSPLETFGPEILNSLIEGSKRKIEVNCAYSVAARLRLRLHQLRTQMRNTNHQLYPIVARAKVSIIWDEKAIATRVGERGLRYPKDKNARVTLVIAPHDDDFADLLAGAGVNTKRDTTDLLTGTTQPDTIEHNTTPESSGTGLEALIFDEGENK